MRRQVHLCTNMQDPCIEHVEGARSKATSHFKYKDQREASHNDTVQYFYPVTTLYITGMFTVLDVLKEWTAWTRILLFKPMKSGQLSRGVAMISNGTQYEGGETVILHPGAGNEVALFSLSVR